MNRYALATLCTALAALSGCAKDRTIDDWRRDRVGEESAKISAISGVYRGNLSARDGTPMGAIEVELTSDKRVGDSKDRPGSEQQAVVRSKVTLKGQRAQPMILTFNDGAFDSASGDFRSDATVEQRNSQKRVISLDGNVAGDTLTGRIEAFGFSQQGGVFTLVKDGPEGGAQGLHSDRPGAGREAAISQSFAARAQYVVGPATDVSMLIVSHQSNPDQQFLDLFVPVKSVDISLTLDEHTKPFFANAQWDRRTGELLGSTEGDGADHYHYKIDFDCFENQLGNFAAGLSCTYTSAQLGLVFRANFLPSGAAR